uniref:Myosin tail domain-containing protein n=1 Tax=Ditylenchus dipsaci TaxID=166011 RepID=A0A915D3J7_9BILA
MLENNIFLDIHKDDAGKSVHELEKEKRRLEEESINLRAQVEELEDALQLAEDARLRSDVNLQAIRNENERSLSLKDQEAEEKRRSLKNNSEKWKSSWRKSEGTSSPHYPA